MTSSFLAVLLVAIVTTELTSAVILRPKWFPYFRHRNEDGQNRNRTSEDTRSAKRNIQGDDSLLKLCGNKLDCLVGYSRNVLKIVPQNVRDVPHNARNMFLNVHAMPRNERYDMLETAIDLPESVADVPQNVRHMPRQNALPMPQNIRAVPPIGRSRSLPNDQAASEDDYYLYF